MTSSPRYVIVSPVKDEERYVGLTLKSVTSQTLKPVLWLIVDDGSTDSTPDIVQRYLSSYPFVRLTRNPLAGVRQPGSAVIRAFNWGYESIDQEDYNFIVKLDCDLSFEPDYFEKLLERFTDNTQLGIASGVYLEKNGSGLWNEVVMPVYHAAGACKVMRRKCFEDIGGFIVAAGWDTVDEIRAMTLGYKSSHFRELRMKHHKPEGSGIGALKTSMMQGEIYCRTGGSVVFFVLKALHRVAFEVSFIRAFGLIWGYLRAKLGNKELLVTEVEARYYKKLLLDRMRTQITSFFRWESSIH